MAKRSCAMDWDRRDPLCGPGELQAQCRLLRPAPDIDGSGESSGSDSREPKRFPVVLFLHGAGERGCDGHAHLRDAGRFARLAPEPCFVLAPQCPLRRRWVEVHWGNDHHTMPTKPGAALELAVNHLDELLKQEPEADRQRVYLVGLSMGGFGVWDALTRWPGRFAGALAICGGADDGALEVAGPPALPPVWAFHGAADGTVRPHRSKGAYEALRRNHRAAGIPEAASRYTVYDGVGHACWDRAFQAAAAPGARCPRSL